MSVEITLQPVTAQSFKIVLNEQSCEISIRERLDNLYMSMVVDGVQVWDNYVCYNAQNVKPFSYMNFNGGLYFIDSEGETDPVADELNSRYFLIYLTDDEIAEL